MVYLGNAFSLQMLDDEGSYVWLKLEVEEVGKSSIDLAIEEGAYSCIGHQDLAKIVGVPFNRESITLKREDILFVVQVVGGRLAEGTTELPKGVSLKYFKVRVMSPVA